MRLSRHIRCVTALFVLASLLFGHAALAMYQCPGEAAPAIAQAVDLPHSDSMPDMAGCDGMDTAQPALCQAHAQSGNQSLDKPSPPDVPAFALAGFFVVPAAPSTAGAPTLVRIADRMLAHRTAPSLAVRNCCFRT